MKTNTENKEVFCYEDDISAKEEIPCKGSWFPCKNEHKGRKKGINSLKKNRDFQRVYSKRQSFANRSLVMYKMSNDRADTRIGISVSKKVGNSVVRHRVTRVIRECCRLHEKELIQGLDIVIVARPLAKEQGLMEIEEAFFHVGRKLNIFLESK